MSDRAEETEKTELHRIADIILDEHTVVRRSPDVEHERKIAIYDLLEENYFAPKGAPVGPYVLHLGIEENRLAFDIRTAAEKPLRKILLSLTPFRRVVKDYFLICDSYYKAIQTATPSQIEAIDMGRRGIHDDGSRLLMERLAGKIELDFGTARRLFTLICVLHLRG